MKIQVYLTAEGAESHALGRSIYNWHLQSFPLTDDGELPYKPDPTHIFLTEVEVSIPSPAKCAEVAQQKLEARLQEMRAEAYTQEREIQTRIQNLLALPAPEAKGSDSYDDIPM